MILTEDQQKAVEIRDKNLIVSAAAGSGKTRILVERIKKMILSGECDIDKLLVVTFTNAAAQEMRTRIYDTLAKESNRVDSIRTTNEIERIERQKILISGASIMTMHAFCQTLLKRYFAKIDLDPKFRLADEQELNLIRQDVIEELFETKYEENDEEFLKFTDEFGGNEKGDSKLHEMILDLYTYSQCQPYPENWLKHLSKNFEIAENATLKDTIWYKSAMKQIIATLDALFDECELTLEQAYDSNLYISDIENDRYLLLSLKRATSDWQRLYDAITTQNFKTLTSIRKCDDMTAKDSIQLSRNEYKEGLKKLRQKYFFATESEMLDDLRAVKSSMEILIKTTMDFSRAFSEAKHEKCIIDFNDMEHLALQILSDNQISKTVRNKYHAVMVDEYQDINGVQDAILKIVTNEKDTNFFAVGDIKQSIYGFRLTDSSLFRNKYKDYASKDNLVSEKIDLSQNFRSRSTVLDSVNVVFESLMTEEGMEIEYDENARLYCGMSYPYTEMKNLNTPTEFYLITQDSNDEKLEIEAQVIANRIKELMSMNTQVYDTNTNEYRDLKYRDIVILLRSQENTASKFKNILEQNDIKSYSIGEKSYFKALEIQIMLSLLSILDNVRQDIPLAAVMMSPIGGFTAEELASMRIYKKYDADLFTVLTMVAAIDSQSAKIFKIMPTSIEKAKILLKKINDWREMSRTLSVTELITTIYRETGYYDYVGGLPEGVLRQANLRMLIDRASDYEATAFHGLSRFLKFVKKIKELKTDLSVARTLGESEDVVRIMTIHKSKGLEFPVVFVANLEKQFNFRDESVDLVVKNRTLGIGPMKAVKNEPLYLPTFARQVIAQKNIEEQKAEELRILYTAMTRAREKLILVGSINANDKKFEKFNRYRRIEKLPTFVAMSANSFLDWIRISTARCNDDIIKTININASNIKIAQPITDENIEEVEVDMKKLEHPTKISSTKNIPSKMSVTELKMRIETEDELVPNMINSSFEEMTYRRPDFEQSKKLTGAEYGLIMHSLMQRLDLYGDLSSNGIREQIASMVERKIFTLEQAKILRYNKAALFFASDIGKRMINANEIYRELPFSRLVDVSKFYPNVEDKIFIQGIIDVLFRDEYGFVLLDYKTDNFLCNDEDIDKMREKYRLQIELYSEAIEAIIKKPIDEKYLYMLSDSTLIPM